MSVKITIKKNSKIMQNVSFSEDAAISMLLVEGFTNLTKRRRYSNARVSRYPGKYKKYARGLLRGRTTGSALGAATGPATGKSAE